jgi:glycosyltransferase involved in cell wall biosynthesis
MKILFDCPTPVLFAHGGAQIQIEQTKAGLEANGVEVEYLRWWDATQTGDLVHFFGTASNSYLNLARSMGKPVVMTNLFTEACNRSPARLARQGWVMRTALHLPLIKQIKWQLNWLTYQNATHNVVGLECERVVLEKAFGVARERISLVPLGLSDTYLRAGAGQRQEAHLICTGTITERKNSVALAQLAHRAEVPILFVGKPYSMNDLYWRRFQELTDGRLVKYQPHVASESEMIRLLQAARGFVLMSQFENWCLSAHEAIACGLPLLVPDQNWSRERFGEQVRYFPTHGDNSENTAILKQFYNDSPRLSAPAIQLDSWGEAGRQLKIIYQKVLGA